jgi:hypothetical protein
MSFVLPAEQIALRCFVCFWKRLTFSSMIRAESAHITVDGTEYDVVLHVYGEQDWRGFLIKPGSQVRKAALKERLH